VQKFLKRRWVLVLTGLIAVGLLLFFLVSAVASNKSVQPVASAVSVPALTNKNASQIGDEYLALGDSVAFGVGASPPTEKGYAGIFYQDMKKLQPQLTYKNLAIPGETSESFVRRTGKVKSQLERTLDEIDAAQQAGKRVSPITLTIGGNDMLNARNSSDAEREAVLQQFDTNLKNSLEQLNRHTPLGSQTDLILTTYYNPFGESGSGSASDLAWLNRFNAVIKQRAAEYKAQVVDFYGPVAGHEQDYTWISEGDVHPNASGYALLASAIWQAVGYEKS
jgi:lysophospholipase L1-like esterase